MSEELKTGVKHDKDPNEKPKITLVPLKALWEVAKVMTFGAQKYGRFNWKGGIDYSRLADAACRHIIQFMEGEDNDKEFGLSHLAHAACGILMLLEETTMNKPELDDRYKNPLNIDNPPTKILDILTSDNELGNLILRGE